MLPLGRQITYDGMCIHCMNREEELPTAGAGIIEIPQNMHHKAILNHLFRTMRDILRCHKTEIIRIREHRKFNRYGSSDTWEKLFGDVQTFIDKSSGITSKESSNKEFISLFFKYVCVDPIFTLNMLSSFRALSFSDGRVLESVLHTLSFERRMISQSIYACTSIFLKDCILNRIRELGGTFLVGKATFSLDWDNMAMTSSGAMAIASIFNDLRKKKAPFSRAFLGMKEHLDETKRRLASDKEVLERTKERLASDKERLDEMGREVFSNKGRKLYKKARKRLERLQRRYERDSAAYTRSVKGFDEAFTCYTIAGLSSLLRDSQTIEDLWAGADPVKGRMYVFSDEKWDRLNARGKNLAVNSSQFGSLLVKKASEIIHHGQSAQCERAKGSDPAESYAKSKRLIKELDVCLGLYELQREEADRLYGWGCERYHQLRKSGLWSAPKEAELAPMDSGEFCSETLPSHPLDRVACVSNDTLLEMFHDEEIVRLEKLMAQFIREEHVRFALDRLGHEKASTVEFEQQTVPEEVCRSFLPQMPEPRRVVQQKRRKSVQAGPSNKKTTKESSWRSPEVEVNLAGPSILPLQKESWSEVVARNSWRAKVDDYRLLPFRVHERVSVYVERFGSIWSDDVLHHGYSLCISDFLVRYGLKGVWLGKNGSRRDPHFSCAGTVHHYGEEKLPETGCFTAAFFWDSDTRKWVLYHQCFIPKHSGRLINEYTERGFYTEAKQRTVSDDEKLSKEVRFQQNGLVLSIAPLAITVDDRIRGVEYTLSLPQNVRENWGFSLRSTG